MSTKTKHQPAPCTCGRYPFPHRATAACVQYAADLWQEEHDLLEDERLNDPRHSQADEINRERPCMHSQH